MAGILKRKLNEILVGIQMIQDITLEAYAPETVHEKQQSNLNHMRNLKFMDIEGDCIDVQIRWISARGASIRIELWGIEPWTWGNKRRLDICIANLRILKHELNRKFRRYNNEYTILIQGLITELMNSMKNTRWEYLRPSSNND